MDPNETLKLIVEAIQEKTYEAALYHTQNLKTWISKDGALPKVFEPYCSDTLVWCRMTMILMKALELERIEEIEARDSSCYDCTSEAEHGSTNNG